ncbi:MAG: hypothetical protein R2748_31655 [Bryobacterales bacterium]
MLLGSEGCGMVASGSRTRVSPDLGVGVMQLPSQPPVTPNQVTETHPLPVLRAA